MEKQVEAPQRYLQKLLKNWKKQSNEYQFAISLMCHIAERLLYFDILIDF